MTADVPIRTEALRDAEVATQIKGLDPAFVSAPLYLLRQGDV